MADNKDKINGAKRNKGGEFSPNLDLTDKQLEAINLLVWDRECAGNNPLVAEKIGMSRKTVWQWTRKNEEFIEELQKERKRRVLLAGDVALNKLIDIMEDGGDVRSQLQAIKLVLSENNIGNSDRQSLENTSNNFKIVIKSESDDIEVEQEQ